MRQQRRAAMPRIRSEAFALEQETQRFKDVGLIVGDQDARSWDAGVFLSASSCVR